jgi:hypothetical protein
MTFRTLNCNLSYPLDCIDPCLDSSRDEGEERRAPLRCALRLFGKSIESAAFCDRASEASLGALLASKRGAELGGQVFDAIMSAVAPVKASACLVSATTKLLTADEADQLSEDMRVKCVPVAGTESLAIPADSASTTNPHVSITVPKGVCGGARDARLDVERIRPDAVKLSFVSSSGARKFMTSGKMPEVVLDKLFKPIESSVVGRKHVMRHNELPDYIKTAIVNFLETRFRLQALCTAAVPSPGTRPVALDWCYLRDMEESHKNWLRINCNLHPSSSACLCGAHGLRFDWKGSVAVQLECCGRRLEEDPDGRMCCPCHPSSNQSTQIDGYCTVGASVSVTCFHRQDRAVKRGISVTMNLTEADRAELSTIMVGMLEFEGRTSTFFGKKWATNQKEVDSCASFLEQKLAERLRTVHTKQASEHDPGTNNFKELIQRDMTAVDLMRGGGVFRHHVKRGDNRGKPYLARVKKTSDTKPLTEYETDLLYTHGHLFRKAL